MTTPTQDLREHFLRLVASTGNLGQRLDKDGNNLERYFNAIGECEEDVKALHEVAMLDPERTTVQEAIQIATQAQA